MASGETPRPGLIGTIQPGRTKAEFCIYLGAGTPMPIKRFVSTIDGRVFRGELRIIGVMDANGSTSHKIHGMFHLEYSEQEAPCPSMPRDGKSMVVVIEVNVNGDNWTTVYDSKEYDPIPIQRTSE